MRIKGHKSWNHPWDKSGLSSINSPWIEVEKGDSELARSTVKEPCCREGKKPPFVAVFQIFWTTYRTFFGDPSPIWVEPPRPTRCLHHRLQVQVPVRRSQPVPWPETCPKILGRNRKPLHSIFFWVVVWPAQVTIGHIVASKSFTTQLTTSNNQALPESLSPIAGKRHTSSSDSLSQGNFQVKPLFATTEPAPSPSKKSPAGAGTCCVPTSFGLSLGQPKWLSAALSHPKASPHSWLQAMTKPSWSPYRRSPENATQVAAISLSSGTFLVKPLPSAAVTKHWTTTVLPPPQEPALWAVTRPRGRRRCCPLASQVSWARLASVVWVLLPRELWPSRVAPFARDCWLRPGLDPLSPDRPSA